MKMQLGNNVGEEIYSLIERLYPICRSITGNGVRETLSIIGEYIPLEVHEVSTGTQVFDWKVPEEWNIRDAYIKDSQGNKIVDFRDTNLHVVSYSIPVHRKMMLDELKGHLFSLPDHPEWVPYRTSYYSKSWGFCLTHNQLSNMSDGVYEVCIDSTLEEGSLTYGECFLPGETEDEILLYTHICHPSLCNDNLSGIALVVHLAKYIAEQPRRYSYRILFAPGTIGSITWLSINEQHLQKVKHGLVIALVKDQGQFTYKRSRQSKADIDRVVEYVLQHLNVDSKIEEFTPYGYDERQFCSPGINLALGRLTRSANSCYPEYHTSGDNLGFVHPAALKDSFEVCVNTLALLEKNHYYLNNNPKCEPQLGRRGLYHKSGGLKNIGQIENALLWVLNLSDSQNSLLDIAERSGLDFEVIYIAATTLEECGLLSKV